MATYFVYSGAAGTNTGASWANAFTAFGSAVTAATTAGDKILVHYLHAEELAADTTYTIGANGVQILSVNKDSSDAPTVMGTGGWIGNSTTFRSIAIAGADRTAYFWGITFRISGATFKRIDLGNAAGAHQVFEQCYFWQGNTSASSLAIQAPANTSGYVQCIDCTFRFGSTSQNFGFLSSLDIIGGSIAAAGSIPTTLFQSANAGNNTTVLKVTGMDLSQITGTLCVNNGAPADHYFDRCKLGAGVTVLATQSSNPTKASARAWVTDCHSGDTHTFFGYYDALGSVISDTGVYFTSGAAAQSWKIVTSANANAAVPFETPQIATYNSTLSAITPYLEIARVGSTTAYQDNQVWAEFFVKNNSGSPLASRVTDRVAVNGTAANQAAGAGTGSWTGVGGTAWSGKIDSGSSVTPAEVGDLSVRISVGAASTTVYVDPQIRT